MVLCQKYIVNCLWYLAKYTFQIVWLMKFAFLYACPMVLCIVLCPFSCMSVLSVQSDGDMTAGDEDWEEVRHSWPKCNFSCNSLICSWTDSLSRFESLQLGCYERIECNQSTNGSHSTGSLNSKTELFVCATDQTAIMVHVCWFRGVFCRFWVMYIQINPIWKGCVSAVPLDSHQDLSRWISTHVFGCWTDFQQRMYYIIARCCSRFSLRSLTLHPEPSGLCVSRGLGGFPG